MDTYEKIVEIVSDKMDIEPSEITKDATFDSLQIDSLDMVEIVMDLENEFGMEMDATEELVTIGDLVKYIDDNK